MSKQGIAIGNGLTDPGIQYAAYPDYALNMKLIGKSDYDDIKARLVPRCQESIKSCGDNLFSFHSFSCCLFCFLCFKYYIYSNLPGPQGGDACVDAYSDCNDIFNSILSVVGGLNVRYTAQEIYYFILSVKHNEETTRICSNVCGMHAVL